ncbi:MAG: hypothetical protein HY855_06960 [Burkholderiales bacterium]|nr:hypothetical protein [Burkholderiales bacterium]
MAHDTPADGAAPPIAPFWQKLPFIFLFPFRFGPLVFLACLVGASALAGLLLGTFGLVFKGLLVYLGLRYGFNVLELFAKGRFEGESVDHTLWGPERRPAKLGGVIALYILAATLLGDALVDARIQRDVRVQDQLIEQYRQQRAADDRAQARERADFEQRIGLPPADTPGARDPNEDDPGLAPDTAPAAERGPSRQDMLDAQRPEPWDGPWLRLLPGWYWAAMVLLSLMLPSAMIVIALDDAFFRALNPLHALRFIGTMGSGYLALWALFLLIGGTRQAVFSAAQHWSPVLRLPLELGLATYLGLVLCALTGYALYQFHRELGLDVEVDAELHHRAGGAEAIARAGSVHRAARQAVADDPLERKLQPLLAQGHYREAIAELKDHMRYDRLDPVLNTRLHELHVMQSDTAATLAHGQQWLSALAKAGRQAELLAALRKLLALDPQFEVQDGAVVLPAASQASRHGDHALAVRLVKGFDKRFPDHADTPGVVFLGARLLSEYARQHDKAAALLRQLLARFPQHALATEVQTYLTVLERMPVRR